MEFLLQMSDPREAKMRHLIYTGCFQDGLKESKYSYWRMLGEFDTVLEKLRTFFGEKPGGYERRIGSSLL